MTAVDTSYWSEALRPLFDGRRVILKHEVVAGACRTVRSVRELGATEVFVLATSGTGTGPLPEPEDASWYSLDLPAAGDVARAVHASNAAIADLPAPARAELDRFDPDRSAVVIGDFLNESSELDGRPFLAHRRPEWLALDDKTVIDSLWDRCGVPRAPSRVVAATVGAVGAVWDELDRGEGVVLAIDATDGWTGGGNGVRRVQDPNGIDGALDGWRGDGRSVRVMPFLEGIPCSIHGIVLPGGVIALRPVEMVVLRGAAGGFFYAGCGSFWDPPERDREDMRDLARRVGAQLRDEVDYRGAFTVDGVMSVDGFRPTELNPRNGAGLSVMARSLDFDLQLVLDAIVAGTGVDWRAGELERTLVATFDASRVGGTWRVVPGRIEPRDGVRLAASDGELADAGEEEPADVTCEIGPSPAGSFVRAVFDPDRMAPGRSVAPLAALTWAHLDATYGLGIGPLTPAVDVRR